MSTLKDKLAILFARKPAPVTCDTCAFVEFFRSNGDGQTPRLQAFCRCPGGAFESRPVPRERRCERWERASEPPEKPRVGDPTLTV
jgi:hypothetical protein